MDMEQNVRKFILQPALQAIKEHGIYWNGSITDVQGPILERLLREHGYNVVTGQPGPHYENVYYIESEYSLNDVARIAKLRAR